MPPSQNMQVFLGLVAVPGFAAAPALVKSDGASGFYSVFGSDKPKEIEERNDKIRKERIEGRK